MTPGKWDNVHAMSMMDLDIQRANRNYRVDPETADAEYGPLSSALRNAVLYEGYAPTADEQLLREAAFQLMQRTRVYDFDEQLEVASFRFFKLPCRAPYELQCVALDFAEYLAWEGV